MVCVLLDFHDAVLLQIFWLYLLQENIGRIFFRSNSHGGSGFNALGLMKILEMKGVLLLSTFSLNFSCGRWTFLAWSRRKVSALRSPPCTETTSDIGYFSLEFTLNPQTQTITKFYKTPGGFWTQRNAAVMLDDPFTCLFLSERTTRETKSGVWFPISCFDVRDTTLT